MLAQGRHYYASVLFEDGVTVRALADYLGHADPGFTLRVYAQLMPATEGRARAAFDTALGSSAGQMRVKEAQMPWSAR